MHCVLTGGEPCSQDILLLTRRLMEAGLAVQLETSGTEPIRVAGGVFVTLSPKGARPPLEESWARADEVKLPVQSPADIERYEGHLAALPPAKVCLQPVSQGREATALCIRTCMARGWRLSLQMHKYLDIR
jgi:7-carboxy-7-deazaguanine synthase